MPRGRPKKLKAIEPEEYALTLETSGKVFNTAGATILDTLNAIPLEWHQVKGKGIMTITQGQRKHQHLFYTQQLRKLFVNKITRLMWAKRLELFLV